MSHVFEAPQALGRVVATHYSSQLTKQIFAILGSLAIFGAPADFITNVGTGVRDFFYEPINGAVHGPKQFIEGLEAGTSSLARGVFVGVVRGAAKDATTISGVLEKETTKSLSVRLPSGELRRIGLSAPAVHAFDAPRGMALIEDLGLQMKPRTLSIYGSTIGMITLS